eukprot:GHVR01035283.1.p1 GENE.GHVR01035283.1~~GHVR01035283.1.p1  ORF type:complete len:180 (+),score=27.82 GHVR01035283.1:95-634(+)
MKQPPRGTLGVVQTSEYNWVIMYDMSKNYTSVNESVLDEIIKTKVIKHYECSGFEDTIIRAIKDKKIIPKNDIFWKECGKILLENTYFDIKYGLGVLRHLLVNENFKEPIEDLEGDKLITDPWNVRLHDNKSLGMTVGTSILEQDEDSFMFYDEKWNNPDTFKQGMFNAFLNNISLVIS